MAKLVNLREVEVTDILSELPDLQQLDISRDCSHRVDALFLVALGFEDRCVWIPELMAKSATYKADQAVFLEYRTNVNDNDLNRSKLVTALESFASRVSPLQCDADDYTFRLRGLLQEITARSGTVTVTFDISSCSSRVLVCTLTILLDFDIDLRIVYSEASVYHPTKEEYESDPSKWTSDEGLGLARGVSGVIPSPDHPGSRGDILPEAVVVFPTFKPERARAIIAYVDPSLRLRPGDRVIWMVGDPHRPEDHWRAEVLRTINGILQSAPVHEVSTFEYKRTLEALDRVYRGLDGKCHVTIAPLGSKLQALGIVVFWFIRPEVSIIFASPREYNAVQYSEGCKAIWRIEFGSVKQVRQNLLDTVGELRPMQ